MDPARTLGYNDGIGRSGGRKYIQFAGNLFRRIQTFISLDIKKIWLRRMKTLVFHLLVSHSRGSNLWIFFDPSVASSSWWPWPVIPRHSRHEGLGVWRVRRQIWWFHRGRLRVGQSCRRRFLRPLLGSSRHGFFLFGGCAVVRIFYPFHKRVGGFFVRNLDPYP